MWWGPREGEGTINGDGNFINQSVIEKPIGVFRGNHSAVRFSRKIVNFPGSEEMRVFFCFIFFLLEFFLNEGVWLKNESHV
jgi:hypothetical protein